MSGLHHFRIRIVAAIGLPIWMAILLTCGSAGIAQPPVTVSDVETGTFQADDGWYFGYLGFRMLLQEKGLQQANDIEAALQSPRQSVVVILDNLSRTTRGEWLRLRRFVAQGGMLLVAGEESCEIPGVTRMASGPAETLNSLERYSEFSDVLVLPCNSAHPLCRGVKSVVVNRTGWMTASEDNSLNWTVLAELSDQTMPVMARRKAVLMAGTDSAADGGAMLIAADKSLFSDGMIWHGDNSILAINTVDMLCRGNRTLLAVIESGRLISDSSGGAENADQDMAQSQRSSDPQPNPGFPEGQRLPNFPEALRRKPPARLPPPEPDLKTVLKTANSVIDKVQQSNLLNETLRDRPRNMRPLAWLRTILLLLAGAGILWLLYQLFSRRAPAIPQWKSRIMQSLFGVYSAQQLSRSEYGPAAQVLCRGVCTELTGSDFETDWIALRSRRAQLPALAALPTPLRRSIDEIVSIAVNGSRMYLPRRKFQSLGQSIRELQALHRKSPLMRPVAQRRPADEPGSF